MLNCRKIFDQEEEYVKINEELELEARGLLQQLDHVMKRQESEESSNPTVSEGFKDDEEMKKKPKKDEDDSKPGDEKVKTEKVLPVAAIGGNVSQPPKLTRNKSDFRMRDKLDGNVIPESVKSMGQDGIMRFLKAKVQILTEQVENMQKDEKKLIEKVKELQSDRERVSEDRDKWIQQANAAKNILVKHEQHANDIVLQLQGMQSENGYLKKEVEKLKKELKQATQGAGSNEVRLNRANEEVERLKATIKQMKQEEKDARDSQKKKLEEATTSLKRIEKQKVELLHAFKKQLAVVDSLKKQRGLAEAGKLLKTIEDDFMEFLDWNPNKA